MGGENSWCPRVGRGRGALSGIPRRDEGCMHKETREHMEALLPASGMSSKNLPRETPDRSPV